VIGLRSVSARALTAVSVFCTLFVAVGLGIVLLPGGRADAAPSPRSDPGRVTIAPGPDHDPGVELPDLRHRSARTFQRADGLRVARIYARPVNFANAAGDWQELDNTLGASSRPGFAFAPKAGGVDVDLPHDITDPLRVGFGAAAVTPTRP
jgi:hypothetical protein